MGIRKFVHYLCEAESQMKLDLESKIMVYFTHLLNKENLINNELKSLLDMSVNKHYPEKKDNNLEMSKTNSLLDQKHKYSTTHYSKCIERHQLEINMNDEITKNNAVKILSLSDQKYETLDESMENEIKNNNNNCHNFPMPSTFNDKILSEYSGNLSESFHDKKINEHNEYKILISDVPKEYRSYSNIKIDHSNSEKPKDGFGLNETHMNVSVAAEDNKYLSSELRNNKGMIHCVKKKVVRGSVTNKK